jgi:hypothetical protein
VVDTDAPSLKVLLAKPAAMNRLIEFFSSEHLPASRLRFVVLAKSAALARTQFAELIARKAN